MGTGMILILAVPFDNWILSKVLKKHRKNFKKVMVLNIVQFESILPIIRSYHQ